MPGSGNQDKESIRCFDSSGDIEVLVDNETAVANVTKMAQSTGRSSNTGEAWRE